MKMKKCFKFLSIAMGLCLALSAMGAKKPNIIFILADDLGYGDVSCLNPEGKIKTPVLDKMAGNGLTFTDAHTSSAVCTPTRYGVITGRYNWRSTLKSSVLSAYSKALIPNDRATMASVLKESGYNTAFIGKWHLGWDWATLPSDGKKAKKSGGFSSSMKIDYTKPVTNSPKNLGFDYYYGICGSLDMPPYVYVENDMPTDTNNNKKQGTGMPDNKRVGDVADDLVFDQVLSNFVDRSCKYIRENAKSDKPFFIYLPINGPHTPIVPSAKYKGRTGMGDYADFVEEIDDEMGKIFKTLKEEGIEDNTIVVFTSDNGCSPQADFPALAKFDHDPSYVFRGTKSDLWEGGHHVACFVQWPAMIAKGSVSDQTICLTDFFATFADAAGYKLKDNEGEDSFDLTPIFKDAKNAPQIRKSTIHHSISGAFSIRMGDWKLLVSAGSGGWSKSTGKEPLQLYNLKDDIEEKNNVVKQHPEIAKELLAQLNKEIDDGRSTAGAKQKNDGNKEWKQLSAVRKNYF